MYYFLPTFFKTFVKLVWNIIYKLKGDIGEYPIPQYCTKKWQIPKYHIANRLNTDTAYFNDICNWFHILMVASRWMRHLIISGIYAQRCQCFFFNILVVRKFFANFHWKVTLVTCFIKFYKTLKKKFCKSFVKPNGNSLLQFL